MTPLKTIIVDNSKNIRTELKFLLAEFPDIKLQVLENRKMVLPD